jgi:hypothetical protein
VWVFTVKGVFMKIDESYFRAILGDLIDENPFACQAVYSLCAVEFTPDVQTLQVTLGERSVMEVNLEFVSENCMDEFEVKAVILHEFLHLLLRHTTRFKRITPAINIALDAVINAIIHRTFGPRYSGFMRRYYNDAPGPLKLLRIHDERDHEEGHRLYQIKEPTAEQLQELEILETLYPLYNGRLVVDDLLDLSNRLRSDEIERLLGQGWVLIGGHGSLDDPLEDLEVDVRNKIIHSFGGIKKEGIWEKSNPHMPGPLSSQPRQSGVPAAWRQSVLPVLNRLISPDPFSHARKQVPVPFVLPVLNPTDRRGWLRSLWNPLLPDITWEGSQSRPSGNVQVYLDVSGSMREWINSIVCMLAEFMPYIRMPFWAFSTKVVPATIRDGVLSTRTTGGTRMGEVYAHIASTRPEKALIVTDGFIENVPFDQRKLIGSTIVEALIPEKGCDKVLKRMGIHVTVLPELPE